MTSVSRNVSALLVAASVVLTSLAQLSFKIGMMNLATNYGGAGLSSILASLDAANTTALGVGIVLYGVSMLLWIFALKRFPVSLAYPMLSLSYLIVYLVATLRPEFGEVGSVSKLVGVTFVVAGIIFVCSGPRTE